MRTMEQREEELHENKARKLSVATLHADMNEENEKRKYRMLDAVQNRDTDRLWDLITASMEAAFIKTLGLTGAAAKRMKGRNKVTFQEGTTEIKEKYENGEEEEDEGKKARVCAGMHSGQANRLTNIARRVQAANAAGVTEGKEAARFMSRTSVHVQHMLEKQWP